MRKADIAAAVGLSAFALSSPAQVIATKFVDGDAPKGTEMQRPLGPIRNAPGPRVKEMPAPPRVRLRRRQELKFRTKIGV